MVPGVQDWRVDTTLLMDLATPSAYGHGPQTEFDTRVRYAFEIEGDRVQCNCPTDEMARLVQKELFSGQGDVTLALHKLLVYPEGGHFAPHMDAKHRDDHYGSVVVFLPSEFEGGELVVSHAGRALTAGPQWLRSDTAAVPDNNDREDQAHDTLCTVDNHLLKFVAFFSDCKHEVRPVLSGCRAVLHYDVVWTPPL